MLGPVPPASQPIIHGKSRHYDFIRLLSTSQSKNVANKIFKYLLTLVHVLGSVTFVSALFELLCSLYTPFPLLVWQSWVAGNMANIV